MPTIHCYFENKAAAACATSALNKFCSICTAFRCLHRIWDRPNGNDGSIYRTGVQGSNGIPVCSRGGESGFATVTLASSPAGKVMGYVLSTGLDGNVYWLAQPFAVPTLELNQVTSIQLYANGSSYLFSADSKVRLYGLKK